MKEKNLIAKIIGALMEEGSIVVKSVIADIYDEEDDDGTDDTDFEYYIIYYNGKMFGYYPFNFFSIKEVIEHYGLKMSIKDNVKSVSKYVKAVDEYTGHYKCCVSYDVSKESIKNLIEKVLGNPQNI